MVGVFVEDDAGGAVELADDGLVLELAAGVLVVEVDAAGAVELLESL